MVGELINSHILQNLFREIIPDFFPFVEWDCIYLPVF